jgi:hypothetical protein
MHTKKAGKLTNFEDLRKYFVTHRRHSDQYLDATFLSRTSCVEDEVDTPWGITDVL